MKILEPIHKRFTLLSICPSDSNEPFIKFRNVALSVTCFMLNTLAAPACLTFILQNLKNDLENTLFAMIAGSATAALCYLMIAGFILRHEITAIFSVFQDISDTCKCSFKLNSFHHFLFIFAPNPIAYRQRYRF